MTECLGPNIGHHFVHAALAAEQMRNRQTRDEVVQIQEIRDKMKSVTDFLKHLEAKKTDNPKVVEITGETKEHLDRIKQICNHALFEKNDSWNKEEVEALVKNLDRQLEMFAGDINPHNVQMGDLLHIRNEVIRIVGKILEMLNKHLENVESRMNR